MKKKLLSSIIVASMLLSSVQPAVLAAEYIIAHEVPDEETVINITEPTPELMEETIKKVRPFIDVPEEYTEFNWDYRTGYTDKSSLIWCFSWTDNKTGEISVMADSEGRITNYNHYKYERNYSHVLPSVSPEELQILAETFMSETAPHLSKLDLRLESIGYPSIYYNQNYTFKYVRYENDIPVYDNYVTIRVNHITKEVSDFSASVDLDVPFEAPDGAISEEEAKQILSENQKMILSYRFKTEFDDEGNLKSKKAYLVYTPEKGYISVDAVTGDVYTERNQWQALRAPSSNLFADSATTEESVEMEKNEGGVAGGKPEYQLTDEELEQLEVLEKLISKDEAVKTILENKDLFIPENTYLSDASLNKQHNYPVPLLSNEETSQKYVWNLYFSVPEEDYFGINAVVDAQDGSLISYSSELPYYYQYETYGIDEPEISYTEEQAIEIATEFIKKMQPEKAKDVAFSNAYGYAPYKYEYDDKGFSTPYYRAHRLTFARYNEGVEFSYNYFTIGVDRSTGKITRYSLNWYDDVEFESPKDAIGEKQALMALYSYDGFGINYEVNNNYTYIDGKYESVSSEVYSRAVYSDYNLGTTTIRALDGKMINYDGEEYVGEIEHGPYTDIENHWGYETIQRFSWLGAGPEGTLFNPNEYIKSFELASLFNVIGLYAGDEWILENNAVTRMNAVKYLISSLGYSKIAELENVFITDFVDNSDFVAEDVGYAAIARGFGLIEGDGENFRPYDNITRAEAYTLAANAVDLGIIDN